MRPILEVENLSISFLQYDRGARRRVLPAIRRLDLTLEAGRWRRWWAPAARARVCWPTASWGFSPTTPAWRGPSATGGSP